MNDLTQKNDGIRGRASEEERQLRDKSAGGGRWNRKAAEARRQQRQDQQRQGCEAMEGEGVNQQADGRRKVVEEDGDGGKEKEGEWRHLWGPECCPACRQNPFECGCVDVSFACDQAQQADESNGAGSR